MARLARSQTRARFEYYRLGVPELTIQKILRHANVGTTTAYYVKTSSEDVRGAMEKLEENVKEIPALCAEGALETRFSAPGKLIN